MALIGTIKTLIEQCDQSKFGKALSYLQTENLDAIFADLQPGKNVTVELDGKKLFAIYQTYQSKELAAAKMEGHQKYIDIQYIHKGREIIFVSPLKDIVKMADYNDTKDIYFPETVNQSSFVLNEGMASILYPDDIHAPGIAVDQSETVQKIVFKVAL